MNMRTHWIGAGVMLAMAAALPVSAQGTAWGPGPYAQVYDMSTGDPLVGALVSIPGTGLVEATDFYGQVYFDGYVPSTPLIRAATFPPGYGSAVREMSAESAPILLFVAPVGDLTANDDGIPKSTPGYYYSGVIDAALGTGAMPIRFLSGPGRDVEGWMKDFPFDMEIVVPPGAFQEDFRVRVHPLPTWAAILHKGYVSAKSFGQFHIDALDVSGNPVPNPMFLKPVEVRFKPFWRKFDFADLAPDPGVPAPVKALTFDFNSNAWDEVEVTVTVHEAEERIGLHLQHFSVYSGEPCFTCHTSASTGDRLTPSSSGGGGTPFASSGGGSLIEPTFGAGITEEDLANYLRTGLALPPAHEARVKFSCLLAGQAGIYNGTVFGGGNSVSIAKGSTLSLGAEFAASVTAAVEGKTGLLTRLLGEAKASLGTSISVGASGEWTTTTTHTYAGVIQSGPTPFTGLTGSVELMLIQKQVEIYVYGKFIAISDPVPSHYITTVSGAYPDGSTFETPGGCD